MEGKTTCNFFSFDIKMNLLYRIKDCKVIFLKFNLIFMKKRCIFPSNFLHFLSLFWLDISVVLLYIVNVELPSKNYFTPTHWIQKTNSLQLVQRKIFWLDISAVLLYIVNVKFPSKNYFTFSDWMQKMSSLQLVQCIETG